MITMIRSGSLCLASLLVGGWLCTGAQAECKVVGDSVGVGVGMALKGVCSSDALVGLSSSRVAAKVKPGSHWTIASLGSNDFPRGITPALRTQSEARVRSALSLAKDRAGSHLILILPANAAGPLVASWASANGVPTVPFVAGRDGIHPRDYGSLAREIRGRIGA